MFSYDASPGAKQVSVILSDDSDRHNTPLYLYDNPTPSYLQQMVPDDLSSTTVRMKSSARGLVPYEDVFTSAELKTAAQFMKPRGRPRGKLRGGNRTKRAKVELLEEKQDAQEFEPLTEEEQKAYERAVLRQAELKEAEQRSAEVAYNTAYNQSLAMGQETASAIAGASRKGKRKKTDYPHPACHPDQMSDAQYAAYTDTLSDNQYDQFKDDFDLSDSDSDEDEKLSQEFGNHSHSHSHSHSQSASESRPGPASTELPDGAYPTPLAHVGEAFTQQGAGGAKLSRKEQKMLRQGLESDTGGFAAAGPRAPVLQQRYQEAKTAVVNRTGGRELELYGTDRFQLVPSFPKRECIYVTGPQGAGKSTFAAAYASQWRKQHPGGKIHVFSQLMQDPVLDKVGIIRVKLDADFLENPFELHELNSSLCIFDDIDMIKDEKMCKSVRLLRDQLLEVGRKEDTWVVSTSHYAKNWNKTRAALNESEKIVFFLNKGAPRPIRKYLLEDMGWDKDTVGRIVGTGKAAGSGLKSRWVVINNVVPQWFMGETLISLV